MAIDIPDNVSWDEAAAVQPLAVVVQLAKQANLHASQTLGVLYVESLAPLIGQAKLMRNSGCGPLGLLVILVAKAYGIRKVLAFDIQESRVNFAKQCGADIGVVTSPNYSDTDPWVHSRDSMSSLKDKYNLGLGVDVVVEASGAEVCTHMALALLRPTGTCERAMIIS